ncbi:2-phosphosulfolactate phosphatase [Occultella gossypii]|uniref:Probable 2-phosphosulfolactate phosphatase n=1 Tax=Occultella gossypii TaxID=2800820 RepID=A0ABS7SII7_9MICO|nr:2-phosphosulfolactate phosphatase [Occultella gossypii]MBZ2199121.1 2-phosphosulfolactate phosphatase [Occultella gossypii]
MNRSDAADSAHTQAGARVRFEWGRAGAALIRPGEVAVVVDVLSFSTAVSVAADRGIEVLPYPWARADAAEHAKRHDAELAVRRGEAGPGQVSLAPGSLRRAEGLRRVVLPSPNGATISHHLQSAGAQVLAGCLRNAAAVGRWAAARGVGVLVIAAGERWPDGTLRPAVEDLWGAGAVIDAVAEALPDGGGAAASVGAPGACSPEAQVARDAYRAARTAAADSGWPRLLADLASGRELVTAGHGEDVRIAAEVGAGDAVPLLVGAVAEGHGFIPADPVPMTRTVDGPARDPHFESGERGARRFR